MIKPTDKLENKYKVLSFDLDNALYDNQPVIAKAEAVSRKFLEEQFQKQGKIFDFARFLSIRNELMNSNESRFENLTRMRKEALSQICLDLTNREQIVEGALKLFLDHRSKVTIVPEVKSMLTELSENYILVTASNGNCDISQSEIAGLFDSYWSATMDIRAKPHPEMLEKIMSYYEIPKNKLLHIGDSIEKDGGCAANSGVDYYRLAPFRDGSFNPESIKALKTLLLSSINTNMGK